MAPTIKVLQVVAIRFLKGNKDGEEKFADGDPDDLDDTQFSSLHDEIITSGETPFIYLLWGRTPTDMKSLCFIQLKNKQKTNKPKKPPDINEL